MIKLNSDVKFAIMMLPFLVIIIGCVYLLLNQGDLEREEELLGDEGMISYFGYQESVKVTPSAPVDPSEGVLSVRRCSDGSAGMINGKDIICEEGEEPRVEWEEGVTYFLEENPVEDETVKKIISNVKRGIPFRYRSPTLGVVVYMPCVNNGDVVTEEEFQSLSEEQLEEEINTCKDAGEESEVDLGVQGVSVRAVPIPEPTPLGLILLGTFVLIRLRK